MKNTQQTFPKLVAIFIFSLLFLNSGISLATTQVSLVPDTLEVDAGEEFELGLFIDFGTDRTNGGALDISFDSDSVLFSSFEFDSGFTNRAIGLDRIDPQTNDLVSIVFASLGSEDNPALGGAFKIGAYTFTATSKPGASSLILSTSPKWGGFSGIDLEPGVAQIEISPQVVPLPGAVWLFGSALIGAISLNRKKS